MSEEAMAARMEAEHYARLRESELEAERCECGVVSRGLVDGKCADCRDRDRRREIVCDFAGHDFQDAGGGLEVCLECQAERWAKKDG